jgi:hypothetical protein
MREAALGNGETRAQQRDQLVPILLEAGLGAVRQWHHCIDVKAAGRSPRPPYDLFAHCLIENVT